MISRIKLEEGNTEFWRRRFLGEGLNENHGKPIEVNDLETSEVLDDIDGGDDVAKEVEDDEAEDEEEEVEQNETQVGGEQVKDKEVAAKPLQMIGVQLLKDSDQTSSSRKSRRRISRKLVEVSNLLRKIVNVVCILLKSSNCQEFRLLFVKFAQKQFLVAGSS